MKKTPYKLIIICALLLTNCFEDNDDNISLNTNILEINDFVWKGMNAFYVYKDEILDLSNDRFLSNQDYTEYLNDFETPEVLFNSLLHLPNSVDRFSVLTSDYRVLEQQFQGIRETTGMRFQLLQLPNNDIFGYVRYVIPNSDAANKGVTRGIIFNGIDGVNFNTVSNFSNLFSRSSYTLNLANYNNNGTLDTTDDTITSLDTEITLAKSVITENPILVNDIIETEGFKIGYLMYNGFRFENGPISELNSVFGNFVSENIDELVLDLRYNGGGSVSTAIWLSSMITGQFTGQPLFTEEWNPEIQQSLETNNPEALINRFVNEMIKTNSDNGIIFQESINSLNLNKVYILTSDATASASELLINSLSSYIEVIQIGTTTVGKPQASITLYDSENFTRNNVNLNHTYALQPLVYEAVNLDGFSKYYNGLDPNPSYRIKEDYSNLGILGDLNEPLLQRAIIDITGNGRFFPNNSSTTLKVVWDDDSILSKEMFIENHGFTIE